MANASRQSEFDTGQTLLSASLEGEFDYLYNCLNGTNSIDIVGKQDIQGATLTATTSITGHIEGHSVDVVQSYDSDIVDNANIVLVFDFVPAKISLVWSGGGDSITTNEAGISFGDALITVTGTDTISSVMNATHFFKDAYTSSTSTPDQQCEVNDTTNVIKIQTGRIAAGTNGSVLGTCTWTTSTKTLNITFQETATVTANNHVRVLATAYK